MGLFQKKSAPTKTFVRDELYRKEKAKEPMTYEELQALNREKSKDLSNQILRVAGLFAILFAVGLAIFVFLYPFSLFNLFATSKGGGDQFWGLWSNWSINVGKDYNWQDVYQRTIVDGIETFETYGYATMKTVLAHGFMPGSTWKANFYCLGGWSIILIATIGFVIIVVYAAYIVAYNIKDLINVIKHFFNRTVYVVSDIASAGKESVDSTRDGEQKPKKKKSTKKLPEEIKEAINDVPAPSVEAGRKEETTVGGYTSDQLDALLRGEELPEAKKEEAPQKSLF